MVAAGSLTGRRGYDGEARSTLQYLSSYRRAPLGPGGIRVPHANVEARVQRLCKISRLGDEQLSSTLVDA